MSRVPRLGKSSSSLRTQYNASPTKSVSPSTPARLRVPHSAPTPKHAPPTSRKVEEKPESAKERLSLKEQIALKRAEAKKAQEAQITATSGPNGFGVDDDPMALKPQKVEDDVIDLGRWSVRETVERARSTGNINLSSRSLVCIPSCLFEIHLGVTPKPLDAVTEPDYSAASAPKRAGQSRHQPSWFEAQDLMVLKARSNEIIALQPEISLFGSLKTIDLHSNRLTTLPVSLTILASLTALDVSNNNLTEIPPSLFSLPALATLNVAHNQLTTLPFSKFNNPIDLSDSVDTGSFFQPEVSRAVEPLPNLLVLDASHNKLSSASIDVSHLPAAVTRLVLAHNPLGCSSDLFSALAKINGLQEIIMDHAKIGDDSFECQTSAKFPKLQLLDLSDTDVTEQSIQSFFADSPRVKGLNFRFSTAPPSPGELRVAVGKKVVREAWEIEAEKHYLRKKKSSVNVSAAAQVEKDPWETNAEQGPATEGGRRRARAAAAAAATSTPVSVSNPGDSLPKAVEKEQWEIEAEKGLLTEGGRRRLRAQQAANSEKPQKEPVKSRPPSSSLSLAESPYYSASTLTLTLPPSVPPTRVHARAFSLVTKPQTDRTPEDLLVPAPTLPLTAILRENFAANLHILSLSNRRADPSFDFPSSSFIAAAQSSGGILPRLDELYLESCALGDAVSVTHESDDGGMPVSQKKGLLELLADTFPKISVLDLSYNALTSDGLSARALERLLVPSECSSKGLKILRLRGNRLTALEAFEHVAGLFRGNRHVPEWRLEELDVRDNEISKLPVLMGLMPMDVFLVEGNTFRVPLRKVWEREGTKGLLSWLRGRIE
ncbi:hypothetical protein M0805_002196 [Coniferiporia weirii]|nr:hypothetical protein M0805_002196 [Coniferiporia weirii]